MRKILAAILISFVFVSCNDEKVYIGSSAIVLPHLSGFSIIDSKSKLLPMFQATVPESNRLLRVYVSSKDVERIKSGGAYVFQEWIIIQSSRDLENENFSEAWLSELSIKLVDYINKGSQSSDTTDSPNDWFRAGLMGPPSQKAINFLNMVEQFKLIEKAAYKDGVFSSTGIWRVKEGIAGGFHSNQVVSKAVVTLINSKLVYIYFYRDYTNDNDVSIINEQSRSFLNKIKSVNLRIDKDAH